MNGDEDKRLHQEVTYVGLRAQAIAVGFLQLCTELRATGLLADDAVDRIKDKIARELALNCPRSVTREEFGRDVRARLDRLFAGQEKVGSAAGLAFRGLEPGESEVPQAGRSTG